MDVLGSILNAMDKPPSISEKQRQLMKKQKDEMLSKQKAEKERLRKFREKTEKHLSKFLQDSSQKRLQFPPFDQVYRAIVHELAEEAGMTAYSFGQEGVDRYIMVYKKESPPSEDELACLRRGEEWNEEKAKEIARKREEERVENEQNRSRKKEDFVPNSNYREKYQHLIGLDAAKEAARITQTNKQYGFVPSENKKDHRSIEQTLADIQKKKRKLNHEAEQSPSSA